MRFSRFSIQRLLCTGAVMLLASLAGLSSAQACPACQDQVNSSVDTIDIKGGGSQGKGLTSLEAGYSWTVLFLIAMPFGLLSFLIFQIYKECRKMDAAGALAGSPPQKG